ncbi:MAG: hypothetical protein ACK5XN_09390, partial [Bacteroidota bacterium]
MSEIKVSIAALKSDGSNFAAWKVQIKLILEIKELIQAICPSDKDMKIDSKKSKEALLQLYTVMDQALIMDFAHLASAQELWTSLEERFEKLARPLIKAKKRQLLDLKFEENGDMEAFLNDVSRLCSELKTAGAKVPDEDVVDYILDALPESYASLVHNLEQVSGLTYHTLKTRLLHEASKRRERHRPAGAGRGDETLLLSRSRHTPVESQRRPGPGQDFRPRHGPRPLRCYGCNRPGHKVADCPRRSHPKKPFGAALLADVKNASTPRAELGDAAWTTWIVDSGASNHYTSDRNLLRSFQPLDAPVSVSLAKAETSVTAVGKGTITGTTGSGTTVTLHDVFLIKDEVPNLFSVKSAARKGAKVIFEHDSAVVVDGEGRQVLHASCKGTNLYKFSLKAGLPEEPDAIALTDACSNGDANLWHHRLGHPREQTVDKVLLHAKDFGIEGGVKARATSIPFCESCAFAKSQRLNLSHKAKEKRSDAKPFDLVHLDTIGPIDVESYSKARYAVTITDEATNYRWTLFVRMKSDIADEVIEWIQLVKTKYERAVKAIRWDRGTEFRNEKLLGYMKRCGIGDCPTPPGVPELNGTAERTNGVLLAVARTLRISARLPKMAWAEALNTATYLVNRWPQARLGSATSAAVTPYEVLHKKKPNLKYLRVFGCFAYVRRHEEGLKKFEPRSKRCKLLGYEEIGYRLGKLDAHGNLTGKVFYSRDVIFDERNIVHPPKALVEVRSITSGTKLIGDPDIPKDVEAHGPEPAIAGQEAQAKAPMTLRSGREINVAHHAYVAENPLEDDISVEQAMVSEGWRAA